jgi:hypothetical protein
MTRRVPVGSKQQQAYFTSEFLSKRCIASLVESIADGDRSVAASYQAKTFV